MEYSISWYSYSISGGTLEAITSMKSLVCSPTGEGGVGVVPWRMGEYDYEEKDSKFCPPIPKETIYSFLKINDVNFEIQMIP